MVAAKGVAIARVGSGSIAEEIGISPGDRLLSINGRSVRDILEYQYMSADDNLEIEILSAGGELWTADIEKDSAETLGLEFDEVVFDRIRPCINKCIFCFVDQLPSGMRESLYVKDDDYRLSFLFGNFITLTNLSKVDWDKLLEMRLSPLYISVHATDPEVRQEMLGTAKARPIIEELGRLKERGIEVHTQIVLCPGINDDLQLAKTVNDLASLWPSVQSVGIVPVGLTGFREGLYRIDSITESDARQVIKTADQWQRVFRAQFDTGFVYVADEFYIRAGWDFPPDDYYDDYPQIENGIGLARSFLEDFETGLAKVKKPVPEEQEIYMVCGCSAIPVMERITGRLQEVGINIKLIPAVNEYFHGGVTVTGLLTGNDLIRTLARDYEGKTILIPGVMLRDGKSLFLDDISTCELANATGAFIKVIEPTPQALLKYLAGPGRNRLKRVK